MKSLSLVLVAIIFGANAARAASVQIDRDRMLIVDGKRTFVLGLYENPKDEAVLAEVAKAGFNLVSAVSQAQALDRLRDQGLYGWVNLGSNLDFSQDGEERARGLQSAVVSLRNHPALLCWEVPDEALWNCWYEIVLWRGGREGNQQRELIAALTDAELKENLLRQRDRADQMWRQGDFSGAENLADDLWRKLGKEPPHPDLKLASASERAERLRQGLLAGYQRLNDLDSDHPLWMNHAPRNQIAQLAAFNAAADVVGCDIYPVPAYRGVHSDLADRSMTSLGAFTYRMQAADPRKPVWMVVQGFGWADFN
ncbi:MAG: hypothetical protein HY706_02385, partial [Candidatus Hydrogenedentes bacterium]|nr:hypothetical protein [Candidatus Hydrogenedentota bacterium]